jgi:hypothetical protein
MINFQKLVKHEKLQNLLKFLEFIRLQNASKFKISKYKSSKVNDELTHYISSDSKSLENWVLRLSHFGF